MNKPLVGILTACVLLAGVVPSHATMPLQKKAKEAGFPATNCLYCHNERGTYLVKQKEAKKAKEIDAAWLKDFVETKK